MGKIGATGGTSRYMFLLGLAGWLRHSVAWVRGRNDITEMVDTVHRTCWRISLVVAITLSVAGCALTEPSGALITTRSEQSATTTSSTALTPASSTQPLSLTASTWLLSNDDGDQVELTISHGEVMSVKDMRSHHVQTFGDKCSRQLGGSSIDRQLLVPLIYTASVKSNLPVSLSFSVAETVADMDRYERPQAKATVNRVPRAAWIEAYSLECHATSLPLAATYALNTQGVTEIWAGFILFDGITPNDPLGSESEAHALLLSPGQPSMNNVNVDVQQVTDEPLVVCSADPGDPAFNRLYKPVELDTVVALGCEQQ